MEKSQLTRILDIIRRLKANWSEPREGFGPFPLVCRFSPGIDPKVPPTVVRKTVPGDLLSFWATASSAELFLDTTYGQWGLRILSPFDAENETAIAFGTRTQDFCDGDLVIGTFIGDADMLIIRCDRSEDDFGSLIVCNAIYRRAEWKRISNSFSEFLESYEASNGDKFWEEEAPPRSDA